MSGTMMELGGKSMEVESGVPRTDPIRDPLTEAPDEETAFDEADLKSGKVPPDLFSGLREVYPDDPDKPMSGADDVKKNGKIDVDGTTVKVKDRKDAGDFYCEYALHTLSLIHI